MTDARTDARTDELLDEIEALKYDLNRLYEADCEHLAENATLRTERDALRAALTELVACDEIVKHEQHAHGTKVRGGRWKAAWEAARAALAAQEKQG